MSYVLNRITAPLTAGRHGAWEDRQTFRRRRRGRAVNRLVNLLRLDVRLNVERSVNHHTGADQR